MRKLINVIIYVVILIHTIGCCVQKKVETERVLGAAMKQVLVIEQASLYQVDSLIDADTLPRFDRWISGTFVEYNSNKKITKRTIIKQFSGSEIVYVVTGNTEPFKIEKRITQK